MKILSGFYDLHCHSAPAPFERIADSGEIAEWCAEAGMAGIVFKSHFESTVSKVYHARKQVLPQYPNFEIYAGIALNRGVGGLNPGAVEIALQQGAKIVWMPTIDASNHIAVFGGAGTYGFHAMTLNTTSRDRDFSYSVIDDSGRLLPAVKDIVRMTIDYNAVLATGHISAKEIRSLVDFAASLGHKKVVITHPEMQTPGLSFEEMVDYTRAHITLEFCAVYLTPVFKCIELNELVKYMSELDKNYIIISSDGGQAFNPKPHQMIEMAVKALMVKGVPTDIIRAACIDNPKRLLI